MIRSVELYANLLVIDGGCYDVILGVDQLSTFEAVIDCKRRIIIFYPEFEFLRGSQS